jgi:nucleoside-diphosphate-sugar epimerase
MPRVLVLGAAGVVGSVIWDGLSADLELVGIDRKPDRSRGIRRGDVANQRLLGPMVEGVDAVVDLATGSSVELGWPDVHRDMAGRVTVLEALREHGVRRYVFASSNHVTGMYEHDDPYAAIVAGEYAGLDPATVPRIATDWPIRPDSPYGVGKAFTEALTRHYAEEHGLSCICLRIGTVLAGDRPTTPRHFATVLSHADLVRLVRCALDAPPELRHGVYYGVSANTWRFWDLTNARAELGYEPRDDAERFRG